MVGGRGRKRGWSGRGAMAVALLVALILAGACAGRDGGRDGEGTRADPTPPSRTVAFLRAVRTSQPENQAAFLDELASAGYVAGDNLELLAGELDEVHSDDASATAAIQRWIGRDGGVDLIIALSTVGARSAATNAPDTDVLFLVNDPVSVGLVTDLRRPTGRLTGATFRVPADRTLDVARRALPGVTKVGAVYPPSDPAALALADEAKTAAATLGIGLVTETFTGAEDARAAVERLRDAGVGAVWVLNSPTSVRFIEPLAEAAEAASLPIIANTTLVSATVTFQPDTVELYRQIARQALQLFEGVPASDIPVESPAQFVVEVNLPNAAAVGVELPAAFVDEADRVLR